MNRLPECLVIVDPTKEKNAVHEARLLGVKIVALIDTDSDPDMVDLRSFLIEARLDPARFVRLARGTLANLDLIRRVSVLPGGAYLVTLSNGEQLNVSRIQSRLLREQLLRL